jgi:chromosome segregation protein
LQDWQQRWEQFNRALGSAGQTTQVERARIEQLENQLRRHTAQADRLALERDALAAHDSSEQLAHLTEQESTARAASDELAKALNEALEQVQSLRTEQLSAEKSLEAARAERERARAEQTSLEALQKAALTHDAGSATEWLAGAGLTQRPRVAESLEVQPGWERAVETALGAYLEAVCVDGLDTVAGALGSLSKGRVALVEAGQVAGDEAGHAAAFVEGGSRETLATQVRGPAAVIGPLASVFTAETLSEALLARGSLTPGQSIITRSGEWIGKDWLRVSRGPDHHAGVIEREHRLKGLRATVALTEERATEVGSHLTAVRESLAQAESQRDHAQSGIQATHRRHAELMSQLEATRARAQESMLRRERLEDEAAEVAQEKGTAADALARASAELERGLFMLSELDSRRHELEEEREEQPCAGRPGCSA